MPGRQERSELASTTSNASDTQPSVWSASLFQGVTEKFFDASIPEVVSGEDTATRGCRKRVTGRLDGAAGDRHQYRQAGNSQKPHPRFIGTFSPLRVLPPLSSNRGAPHLSWRRQKTGAIDWPTWS